MGEDKGLVFGVFWALAVFRFLFWLFLSFSEEAARAAGLEPQQHQLLLDVNGLPEGVRARIGEIAEHQQIQHHSTVELADRLEEHGYINRKRSDRDKREVLLVLTPKAERVLRDLALHHQELLQNYGTVLVSSLKKVMNNKGRARKEKPAPKLRGRAAAAQD